MANKPWFTANVHAPGTGVALVIIAFTLVPMATLAVAQISCIAHPNEQAMGEAWSPQRIRRCNGG